MGYPRSQIQNGKKGRLRKDRYSSLIIANMMARQFRNQLDSVSYDVIGENARDAPRPKEICTKGLNGLPLVQMTIFTKEFTDNVY